MTDLPDQVAQLVREREHARAQGEFARADELRRRIHDAGFVVTDSAEGPVVARAAAPDEDAASMATDPATLQSTLDQPPSLPLSVHLLYEGHREDLARTMRALARYAAPEMTEVVVVDNASGAAGDIDDIAGEHAGARVLHLSRAVGWAEARNAGLKGARGEVVALMDLSVEPVGPFVELLRAAFADPRVGLAGPYGLVSEDMRSWRKSSGPEVDAIEGYLMAIRREALRHGLLHERFKWYRNADIDLSFQVRSLGYRAIVVPLPVAKHTHRGWTTLDEAERAKRSKRNHYTFFDRWKHREDLLLARAPHPE